MKTIKSYKGFKPDMTCQGFQYEPGKEYTHDGPVELCGSGFHSCENPMDVFKYYSPVNSVFHEVEIGGEMDKGDDKTASSYIKIGASLDIAGICKAAFDYVRSRCTNENNAEPGKPATAGENGAATAGENGAATAGENGAATAGNYGAATSRGKSSSGDNGISVARGNNVRVKGGLGALLVIAEDGLTNYDIKEWKAVVVDGKTIKADTWYCLINGKLVECDD